MINETILAIIIAFCSQRDPLPDRHPVPSQAEVRAAGQGRRAAGALKKQGTPTMGGLVFLTAVVITSLLYIRDYPRIIPVLFMTVGFGVIGFLDDYIKIVMKRSEGLNPVQKLIGQFYHHRHFCILPGVLRRLALPCWYHLPAALITDFI